MTDEMRHTSVATPGYVHALLCKLGNTKTDVAASLMAQGIKGSKSCATRCPIANYIRSFFPGYHVAAGTSSVSVNNEDTHEYACCNMPPQVHDFIRDFDFGCFNFLRG